jgi:hypothetical protein
LFLLPGHHIHYLYLCLFLVVIYSRYIALDMPFYYLDLYRKAWRRSLAGFA